MPTGHYKKRVRLPIAVGIAGVPVICFLIDYLNIHLFVNLSPQTELSNPDVLRDALCNSSCIRRERNDREEGTGLGYD